MSPGDTNQARIEEQRAELAETVAALAEKADVPSRVRDSAAAQADRAKTVAENNPQTLLLSGAAVFGVALTVFTVRRRRAKRRSQR